MDAAVVAALQALQANPQSTPQEPSPASGLLPAALRIDVDAPAGALLTKEPSRPWASTAGGGILEKPQKRSRLRGGALSGKDVLDLAPAFVSPLVPSTENGGSAFQERSFQTAMPASALDLGGEASKRKPKLQLGRPGVLAAFAATAPAGFGACGHHNGNNRKSNTLCPSVAPTPSPSAPVSAATTPRKQLSEASLNLSGIRRGRASASIMLPADGPANDAARARNGGNRLSSQVLTSSPRGSPKGFGPVGLELLKVSSAPTLLSAEQSAPAFEMKTPRMTRGMVRRVSSIPIAYPCLQPRESPTAMKLRQLTSQRSSGPPEGADVHGDSPVSAEDGLSEGLAADSGHADMETSIRRASKGAADAPKPRKPVKRVTFKEQAEELPPRVISSYSLEDGTPTIALKRSMRLQDSLYEMRRVVFNEGADGAEEGGASCKTAANLEEPVSPRKSKEEEEQEALLHQMLRGTNDTVASLKKLADALSDTQGGRQCPSREHVGPTMAISGWSQHEHSLQRLTTTCAASTNLIPSLESRV